MLIHAECDIIMANLPVLPSVNLVLYRNECTYHSETVGDRLMVTMDH